MAKSKKSAAKKAAPKKVVSHTAIAIDPSDAPVVAPAAKEQNLLKKLATVQTVLAALFALLLFRVCALKSYLADCSQNAKKRWKKSKPAQLAKKLQKKFRG